MKSIGRAMAADVVAYYARLALRENDPYMVK